MATIAPMLSERRNLHGLLRAKAPYDRTICSTAGNWQLKASHNGMPDISVKSYCTRNTPPGTTATINPSPAPVGNNTITVIHPQWITSGIIMYMYNICHLSFCKYFVCRQQHLHWYDAVVTREIKQWNNFKMISVYYFTCNHVWNWNKIISAAERVLKLFQN